jgi:outer membrane protein OmpA-like peptidoglycan-associated protein
MFWTKVQSGIKGYFLYCYQGIVKDNGRQGNCIHQEFCSLKYLAQRFLLLAVCLVISGCSTVMEEMEAYFSDEEEEPRSTVYYNGQNGTPSVYPSIAREMSTSSVQIYGLDGAAPVMPVSSGMRPSGGGFTSSVDPNVTVYPFSSNTSMPIRRPSIAPPSSYRPMPAPFDGPLQSPARVGGDDHSVLSPVHRQVPFESMRAAPVRNVAPAAQVSGTNIFFKHGSSHINQQGHQVIDYVAKSNPQNSKVLVEGHASRRADSNDPVARSIANLKMSMDRAYKVSSGLIKKGVPLQQIETRAYGDTMAVGDENQDRRVEIKAATQRPVARAVPAAPAYPSGYAASVPSPVMAPAMRR